VIALNTDSDHTAVLAVQDDRVGGSPDIGIQEQPPVLARDVVAAAAAAGERAAEIRRDRLTADVARWGAIVAGIAAGAEPDGALLAEIAELSGRLQLPVGSLAEDVAVLVGVRKLEDRLRRDEADLQACVQDTAAKTAELKAARQRVRDLEFALATGDRLQLAIAAKLSGLADLKGRNPRLFAPADAVARRLLVASPASAWKQSSQTEVIR